MIHEKQSLSIAEPKYGKPVKILVWINGEFDIPGQEVKLNPAYLRSWNGVLSYLTAVLQPRFGAVRNLYHLGSRKIISCLNDIRPMERYIAVSGDKAKFRKNGYITEAERHELRKRKCSKNTMNFEANVLNFMDYTKKNKRTVIYVMVSGRTCQEPIKVVLTETDLASWAMVLEYLGYQLDVAEGVQYICKTNGKEILPDQVKHGEIYVALPFNSKFVKMDYVKLFAELRPNKTYTKTHKKIRSAAFATKKKLKPAKRDITPSMAVFAGSIAVPHIRNPSCINIQCRGKTCQPYPTHTCIYTRQVPTGLCCPDTKTDVRVLDTNIDAYVAHRNEQVHESPSDEEESSDEEPSYTSETELVKSVINDVIHGSLIELEEKGLLLSSDLSLGSSQSVPVSDKVFFPDPDEKKASLASMPRHVGIKEEDKSKDNCCKDKKEVPENKQQEMEKPAHPTVSEPQKAYDCCKDKGKFPENKQQEIGKQVHSTEPRRPSTEGKIYSAASLPISTPLHVDDKVNENSTAMQRRNSSDEKIYTTFAEIAKNKQQGNRGSRNRDSLNSEGSKSVTFLQNEEGQPYQVNTQEDHSPSFSDVSVFDNMPTTSRRETIYHEEADEGPKKTSVIDIMSKLTQKPKMSILKSRGSLKKISEVNVNSNVSLTQDSAEELRTQDLFERLRRTASFASRPRDSIMVTASRLSKIASLATTATQKSLEDTGENDKAVQAFDDQKEKKESIKFALKQVNDHKNIMPSSDSDHNNDRDYSDIYNNYEASESSNDKDDYDDAQVKNNGKHLDGNNGQPKKETNGKDTHNIGKNITGNRNSFEENKNNSKLRFQGKPQNDITDHDSSSNPSSGSKNWHDKRNNGNSINSISSNELDIEHEKLNNAKIFDCCKDSSEDIRKNIEKEKQSPRNNNIDYDNKNNSENGSEIRNIGTRVNENRKDFNLKSHPQSPNINNFDKNIKNGENRPYRECLRENCISFACSEICVADCVS